MSATSSRERSQIVVPDCAFCGILDGSKPGHILRRTQNTALILSLEGHAILIPEAHVTPNEVDDQLAETLGKEQFRVLRRYGEQIVSGLVDGINMLANLGAAAGQEQEHTHIHFIPRHDGDDLGRFPRNWRRKKSGERRRIADELRRILS